MGLATEKKTVAIVGFGNILLGDDGVGVRLIDILKADPYFKDKRIQLIDGGTAGFGTLSLLDAPLNKLIILDAIRLNKAAGSIYRFTLEDILSSLEDGSTNHKVSIHQFQVVDALIISELMQHRIAEKVVIIGIEPQSVHWSTELSDTIKKTIPKLITLIKEELS